MRILTCLRCRGRASTNSPRLFIPIRWSGATGPVQLTAGADPLSATLIPATVALGEAAVQALYSGLTPESLGLGQVNFRIPEISRQARLISDNNTFYLISAIALAGMVPVLLLRRARAKGPEEA